jgi:hypothetical protein
MLSQTRILESDCTIDIMSVLETKEMNARKRDDVMRESSSEYEEQHLLFFCRAKPSDDDSNRHKMKHAPSNQKYKLTSRNGNDESQTKAMTRAIFQYSVHQSVSEMRK